MAFENMSREEFEELRRRAKEKTIPPTVSAHRSGAQAFQAQEKAPDMFDATIGSIGRFGQKTLEGAGAAAGFGANMFGAAVDQLGKAGGSVVSGLGDVYNAKTQQLGSIGASLTGNREEAIKLAEEAQKNEFRSQTKFSGAAGNVIGAAGSGLMGALGIAAAPIVGTGYGAANSILDVADVAGQAVGAPGIKNSVTGAAGNLGQGVISGLKTAGDVVTGAAEGTIDMARNPLTGQSYGFDPEEKKALGQEALAATNLVGAVTSGVGTAVAKNTIASLGKTGVGQFATRLSQNAAVLSKARVGAAGNWISQLGDELGGMAYRVNAMSKGVDIPLNADVKSLARAYTAERVAAFMKNPAVRMAGYAAEKAAPIAKLHPAYWGTKMAAGVAKGEYNLGVHAYNAVAKTYGLPMAKKLMDMNDPTTQKMVNDMLQPTDMRATAQRAKATAPVYATQIQEVSTKIKEGVGGLFQKAEEMPSVQGLGKQFASRIRVLDDAMGEMSGKGMGPQSAFIENTKAFLRNTGGKIANGMTSTGSGVQKVVQELTDQITASNTIDGLKAVSEKLTKILAGEGIDPADLAANRRFFAQMKKNVADDIEQTVGMYSPESAEVLASAAKTTDAQAMSLAERIQTQVGDAATEAEKTNVFRKEFLDAAQGLDETEAALLMTRLEEFADDFFDNGAVAFRETMRGTPLEKMYGGSSMYKGALPDEAVAMDNAAYEYTSYIEKVPLTQRLSEFGQRVGDRYFKDPSTIAQRLLETHSDDAFRTMANNIELEEGVLKRALSGNAPLMQTKQEMTEITMENMGKGVSDVIPEAKIGEKLVKERGTTIVNMRNILGKDLENKLKTERLTEIDITAALFGSEEAPGFYETMKDTFGVFVDTSTGKWEIPKESLMGVLVKDRNKASVILGELERSIQLSNGRAIVPLKKLDDLQIIFDSLPGKLELSDAGEFRNAFDEVVGKFRQNVLAAYPESIRDAQAAYARISDAYRGLLKLGGVDEATYNRRTVWLPDAKDASKHDRQLIDTVAKTLGKNISRLNGAPADAVDAALTQVFSALEQTPEGVWAARDEIYNLLEYNNLLAELGGVPRTNMMGNAERFAGGLNPEQSVAARTFQQYKNHGMMRAITGLLSVERLDTQKLNMLYNLVRNQAAQAKANPSKVYFAPTIFQKNPLDMPRYEDWETKRRPLGVEDTAQSRGYGEDIGMKDVVLDSPSQTLPDTGNAEFEIPDKDLPF